MIEKVYEVKCDYCGEVIIHGYKSIKFAESMAEDVGMRKYQGHHFCNDICLQKWLDNNKKDILGR